MHVLSLPRHRIETTFAEYCRIFAALLGRADRPDAVSEFERDFSAYVGCKHAIAVSSGRLGMHLILEALDPQPGSEAIVPAFNLFAVIERFCQLGIAPRFCDIRRDDLNIDPDAVEQSITPRTRFLLATHMFGHPADMDRLVAIARRHRLILLEDCAHALGSKFADRFVGTFGRAAIYSFSVLKLVTTFGGGMIATDDDDLADRIRRRLAHLKDQQPRPAGLKKALTGAIMDLGTRKAVFSLGAWPILRLLRAIKPDFQQQIMTEAPRLDRNFDPVRVPALHTFQALLGRSQLGRVEELIARRRCVGAWLDEELASIAESKLCTATPSPCQEEGWSEGVPSNPLSPTRGRGQGEGVPSNTLSPTGGRGQGEGASPQPLSLLHSSVTSRHNGLYYGVLADRAPELREFLFRRGIDSETSEYLNCADLEMYSAYRVDCPVAREVQSRILRLPNYPSLSRRDVRRIARAIRRFYVPD